MRSSAVIPPKRWRRRIDRIGAGLPQLLSLDELNDDPVDLARLTKEEQLELCRLMGQVKQAGLAGLSDADLERFFYMRVILDGEDTSEYESSV
jgi:hypothetical protein